MVFEDFGHEERMHELWNAVQIVRPVHYELFTFGQSELQYYLVTDGDEKLINIRPGTVLVTRPTIITPDNMQPEFRDFFENENEEQMADFLMARTADFSHLKFQNKSGPAEIVSDSLEEVLDRLNKKLDDEEEDHIAILVAPAALAGVALLKYTMERVWSSAPGNIQELRERGFLP